MTRAALVRVAAVLPVALATLLVAAFTLLELAGATPWSMGKPQNLAEAAGLGLGPDMLRFLRAGDDPSQVRTIRPEVISSAITRVNALEAAVWSGKGQVVDLLVRQGALTDPERRRHVYCLASDLERQEIVDTLAKGGTFACDTGRTLEAVLARSKQP
jgi:hypothetical protein